MKGENRKKNLLKTAYFFHIGFRCIYLHYAEIKSINEKPSVFNMNKLFRLVNNHKIEPKENNSWPELSMESVPFHEKLKKNF